MILSSDSPNRPELVALALGRFEDENPGRDVSSPEGRRSVWIIGDTPLDLNAARTNGLPAVLVATGSTPFETLSELKPEVCLPSLADTAGLLRALGATAPRQDRAQPAPGGLAD